MMKNYLKIFMLFLALAVLGGWYQQPKLSIFGYNESAHNFPPDFVPRVTKTINPDFKKDSLNAARLYDATWKTYFARQWDSLLLVGLQLYPIAEDLLSQKYDSMTYEYFTGGYWSIGQAKVYLGEIEEGSKIILEALEIDKRVYPNGNFGTSQTYFGLGFMARDLFNDMDLALDYYKIGEYIARKCSPTPPDWYFNNIDMIYGNAYLLKGEQEKGLAYFNKCLFRAGADGIQKFSIYSKLGNYFSSIGDDETALQYYLKIIPFENKVPYIAWPEEVAKFYLKIGNYKECLRYLQMSEAINKKKPDLVATYGSEVSLFVAKGDYYSKLKNFPMAIESYLKALPIGEKGSGGKTGSRSITTLQALTQTYLAADSLTAAQNTIAELILRETKHPKTIDFTQNSQVSSFTRQPYHLQTLALKGRYFEQKYLKTADITQLQHALAAYSLADTLIERIRDSYRGVGSKNQLSGAAKPIFQHTIDCAYQLWQKTHDSKYLQLAWQATEKSKSVQLLESLRESEAKQMANLKPEDLQLEKRQKRDLDFYEKLVFDESGKPHPDSSRVYNWNLKIVGLKGAQDSLMAVFEKRYPAYYRMKYNRHIASIEEVQSKLSKNEALVEYFLGDSVLFTFLIDKGQAQVFSQKIDSSFLKNIANIRATVGGFHPEIAQSMQEKLVDYQRFTTASSDLYKTLLETPLQNTLAKKLIVVPDDQIGYVPFSALLRQPIALAQVPDYRNLPYLVLDCAVRLEYSGTLLGGASKSNGSGGYLGIAPTYQGSPIASRSLPDSLRFARAYSQLRGGDVPALRYNTSEIEQTKEFTQGQTQTGEGASEAFFKKNAPNASVLHLAMHALTNDSDPMYSMLAFSGQNPADSTGENDGFLHAYELYNMRLNANLAVLSACNTGGGKVVRGEGVMSLARAFKFAGCPNVMMSLWSVNDAAAKDLVVDFFKKLSNGIGKATALQVAQTDFLKNTKLDELTHPYYWATFVMMGDDEPTGFGTWDWWMLGLFAMVLGFLFLIFRIKNLRLSSFK
jgi:CHAT domain-containing protein